MSEVIFLNSFGLFLYSLRKERGMTQQELADLLDITNKAVSKWETGEAFPETAQLVPLADIFGVSVDELLRGKRMTNLNPPMSAQSPLGIKSNTGMAVTEETKSAFLPTMSAAEKEKTAGQSMSETEKGKTTGQSMSAAEKEKTAGQSMSATEKGNAAGHAMSAEEKNMSVPTMSDGESRNVCAVSEWGDPAVWRRLRVLLMGLSAVAVLFALAYLLSACLIEGVSHRSVVVRGATCLLLVAVAFAGACAVGIVLTDKLRAVKEAAVRSRLASLRGMSVAALLCCMIGVSCFVFFSLYAMPEYAHASALIVGMTAGGAFLAAGLGFLAAGLIRYLRTAPKK